MAGKETNFLPKLAYSIISALLFTFGIFFLAGGFYLQKVLMENPRFDALYFQNIAMWYFIGLVLMGLGKMAYKMAGVLGKNRGLFRK